MPPPEPLQIPGIQVQPMRLSRYILPTLKEDPSDAVVLSHRLMMRAGLIRKESAGMYVYLPLGWRVLRKIIDIVREEMDRAGALEFLKIGRAHV